MAVVGQLVYQCGSYPLALEDLVPLPERKVTRDQHGGTLIPVTESGEDAMDDLAK